MIPEKLVTFYGTTFLGQNLALVPRLPNAICGFDLWPRSQNGGAKTTTWLSVGLRGLETSNWPLLKILSSPSSVNERVAFGLLYLPAFL